MRYGEHGLRRLVQSKHAMRGVMLCTFVIKSNGEVSQKVDFFPWSMNSLSVSFI